MVLELLEESEPSASAAALSMVGRGGGAGHVTGVGSSLAASALPTFYFNFQVLLG